MKEQTETEIFAGNRKEEEIMLRLENGAPAFRVCAFELGLLSGAAKLKPGWEDGEITGREERCRISLRTHTRENLLALEFSGGVTIREPRFGCQNSLLPEDGLRVKLLPLEERPFLAVYQHKEWWLRPAFGRYLSEIPGKTQLLIRRLNTGYEAFLAVAGRENRADLAGEENGFWLNLSSNQAGRTAQRDVALVYGFGEEPYGLTERMAAFALELTGKEMELRRKKKFPDILEKWGWCTWDSLGREVSEKAIFEKMEDFEALGLRVPWVLIDDGWSLADREGQRLRGLEADPERFPEGLASTIRVLKERYKVEQVGVWQAVKGYWNGVEPGSEAERELQPFLREYPNGELSVKMEPEAAFGFWDRWHSRLKEMGVSFVKVDSQSSVSLMTRGVCGYGQAAAALHKGLEASADLHFKGNLINCMGMAPEDVWNRHSGSLSRNSDDFTPTVPGSFGEHALQNCYNSIYHGCFYWGDWDMAWSVHEDEKQNILLRAISGGPFYLSDGMGRTAPEKILPVITEEGRVLRCQDVGRPTLDCLTDGGVLVKKPLKVYNRWGTSIYVSAFLSREAKECEDVIRLEDIPGTEAGKSYWVYDFAGKKVSGYEDGKGFFYHITPGEAALYQLIPAAEGVTVIGMTDKYISAAGIQKTERLGRRVLIWPACGGELSFLTDRREIQVICHGGRVEEGDFFVPRYRRAGSLVTIARVEKGMVVEIL